MDNLTEHRKRLRKRFNKTGISSLQDYEIVELLLTFSVPYKDVKPTAKELIDKFGSIKGIFEAQPRELMKFKHVKDKSITLIKFIREINNLYKKEKIISNITLDNREKLLEYCMDKLGAKREEEFHVIYLDNNMKMITDEDFPAEENLYKGTNDRVYIYNKKILKEALDKKANGIIVFHNHPQADCLPSEADKQITKKIKTASESLDIKLFDHIIVNEKNYFSFKENGLI